MFLALGSDGIQRMQGKSTCTDNRGGMDGRI